MKKSKLVVALAAGMLLSVGAHAQEANNLGPAVVAAQSSNGMFGMGAGMSGAAMAGIAIVAFAALNSAIVDDPPGVNTPIFEPLPPDHTDTPAHVPGA